MAAAIQTYALGFIHAIPDIRMTGHFDSWAHVFRTSVCQVQCPWPSQEWDLTINLMQYLTGVPETWFTLRTIFAGKSCVQNNWSFGDYALRWTLLPKVSATPLKRLIPTSAYMTPHTHSTTRMVRMRVQQIIYRGKTTKHCTTPIHKWIIRVHLPDIDWNWHKSDTLHLLKCSWQRVT